MKKLFIFFEFFSIILFLIGIVSLGFVLKEKIGEYRHSYRLGNNIVYRASDVLGISTDKATVTIDFSKQIATGSPLIFGGVQEPKLEHPEAWDLIQNVGVTSLRTTIYPEFSLPPNITLAAYKQNINKVQDTGNWNLQYVNKRTKIFQEAKNRGLKTIAIMAYSPAWLTYNNKTNGVPKDWDVFKDIVKKLYKINRPYIDYLEIWNEPNHRYFLDPSKSPYTRETAYKEIYKNTIIAIREVDSETNDNKKILVGGPAGYNPTDTALFSLMINDDFIKKNLDFISYHNYVTEEPSDVNYRSLMKQQKVENLPLFLDEWNFNSEEKTNSKYVLGVEAIPYVASKFVSFFKMGLAGANYYSLFEVEENSKVQGRGTLAFYRFINNKIYPLQKAKSWRLMSKTLGLGNGSSKIFQSAQNNLVASLGFQNFQQINGLVLVNNEYSSKEISINISNYPLKGDTYARAYLASELSEGSLVAGTNKLSGGPNISFKVAIPQQSVVGITLTNEATLEEKVKSIFVP